VAEWTRGKGLNAGKKHIFRITDEQTFTPSDGWRNLKQILEGRTNGNSINGIKGRNANQIAGRVNG
jgi:hypothetical protein